MAITSRTPSLDDLGLDRDAIDRVAADAADAARDAVLAATDKVVDTAADRWEDAVAAAGTIADEASARWDEAVAVARRVTGRRTPWYERVPTWGWVAAGVAVIAAIVIVVRRRREAAENEAAAAGRHRGPEDPPLGADPGVAAAVTSPQGGSGDASD